MIDIMTNFTKPHVYTEGNEATILRDGLPMTLAEVLFTLNETAIWIAMFERQREMETNLFLYGHPHGPSASYDEDDDDDDEFEVEGNDASPQLDDATYAAMDEVSDFLLSGMKPLSAKVCNVLDELIELYCDPAFCDVPDMKVGLHDFLYALHARNVNYAPIHALFADEPSSHTAAPQTAVNNNFGVDIALVRRDDLAVVLKMGMDSKGGDLWTDEQVGAFSRLKALADAPREEPLPDYKTRLRGRANR